MNIVEIALKFESGGIDIDSKFQERSMIGEDTREATHALLGEKLPTIEELTDLFLSYLRNRSSKKPHHYYALFKRNRVEPSFVEIENALKSNPHLMWTLLKMNEPDIFDVTADQFIFADGCAKMPISRLGTYNGALNMSERMGVEIVNDDLDYKMRKLGRFDVNQPIWLSRPKGGNSKTAKIAYHDWCNLFEFDNDLGPRYSHDDIQNYHYWRGMLRVPKV